MRREMANTWQQNSSTTTTPATKLMLKPLCMLKRALMTFGVVIRPRKTIPKLTTDFSLQIQNLRRKLFSMQSAQVCSFSVGAIRIVASGLYPITALTLLKKSEKKLLIDKGVVTCEQLTQNRDILRDLSIPANRIGSIMAETQNLCAPFDRFAAAT
jgi:hypothetical protein